MFASELSFSQAIMADRHRTRTDGPKRILRLPGERPAARQSSPKER